MRLSLRRAASSLAVCVALVLILSCGGDGERSVTGVIIEVQSPSLTEVDAFSVRDDHGRQLVFGVAPEAAPDPREGFTPQHLRSHSVLGQRVKIVYRTEGDKQLAIRIEDQ